LRGGRTWNLTEMASHGGAPMEEGDGDARSMSAGELTGAQWHELGYTAGLLWDLLEGEGKHRAGLSTRVAKPRCRGG
jgi:hypothetical protein